MSSTAEAICTMPTTVPSVDSPLTSAGGAEVGSASTAKSTTEASSTT